MEYYCGDARVAAQAIAHILTRRLSLLGEGHPDTLASIDAMAWSYWERKDFPIASIWFSKATTIGRRTLGRGNPLTVAGTVGLAWSNHDRRRSNLLELLMAMESARRVFGEEHKYTVGTRARLVEAFHTFPG